MFEEPTITINSETLTPAQAMAVRVAITDYYTRLRNRKLTAMDILYRARLIEVLAIILRGKPQNNEEER